MAVAVKCVHYPNWGNRKIGNIPMHDLENWSRVNRHGMELNGPKCRVRNGTEIPALSYEHDWTDKGREGIDFISLSQRRTEP